MTMKQMVMCDYCDNVHDISNEDLIYISSVRKMVYGSKKFADLHFCNSTCMLHYLKEKFEEGL